MELPSAPMTRRELTPKSHFHAPTRGFVRSISVTASPANQVEPLPICHQSPPKKMCQNQGSIQVFLKYTPKTIICQVCVCIRPKNSLFSRLFYLIRRGKFEPLLPIAAYHQSNQRRETPFFKISKFLKKTSPSVCIEVVSAIKIKDKVL